MLKALKITFLSVLFSCLLKGQVLYYESFSSYSLSTFTNTAVSFNYSLLPANFYQIRDNYQNDTTLYNKPFNIPALHREGWALYNYPASQNDTFLVSTSWLDTAAITAVDRWFVTPAITGIAANSVLSWLAMAPDGGNRDGYQVYITTNTVGSLLESDFTQLFSIADVDNGGAGEETTWTKRGINLSAYAGQNVKIAFRTVSKDKFQLWVDDIKVENMAQSLDVGLTDIEFNKYILFGTSTVVNATVINNGYTTISNLTLNYKVGNGVPISQSFFLSPPLSPFAVSQATFGIPFSLSSTGYNTVKVFISDVNGNLDNVQTNDTLSSFVTATSVNNTRKVLLKKFVSADEGWTADAQVIANGIILADSNMVVMSIHSNDTIATAESNVLTGIYNPTIPSGIIDNKYLWSDRQSLLLDRDSWQSKIAEEETTAVAPVKITVLNKTYNTSTRTLTFDVQLDFTAQLKGDYRLNTSLVENNVCGPFNTNTLNRWNQLSNLFTVSPSPYYQQGAYYDGVSYILNAYQYKHQQVLLKCLDGVYGNTTTIAASGVNAGQTLTQSYSYTLPMPYDNGNIYNADNIYIVSYVEDFDANINKRLILNTSQSKLTSAPEITPVSVEELADLSAGVNVFPNPASQDIHILYHNPSEKTVSVQITSQLGETLYQGTLSEGSDITNIDLSAYLPGIYLMSLDNGSQKTTKKIVVR